MDATIYPGTQHVLLNLSLNGCLLKKRSGGATLNQELSILNFSELQFRKIKIRIGYVNNHLADISFGIQNKPGRSFG